MMIAQAAFQAVYEANPEMPADEVWRRVNRLLHAHANARLCGKHYVTGHVMIHRGAGAFDCAGAHLWPLVVNPVTKTVRRVEVRGPWLGVVPELPRVPVSRVELAPGEVLCLYSDGLLEARNAMGEMYEIDRLSRRVTELIATNSSLEDCASGLSARISVFVMISAGTGCVATACARRFRSRGTASL
jgi:serine phosphatase RsbU (regulator of sigma subunit)